MKKKKLRSIYELSAKDPNNKKNAQDAMNEAERKMQEKVSSVVGENFELKKF